MATVEIFRVGAESIDRFQSLWLELYDRHRETAPGWLAFIDRERSWPLRRALYERWLAGAESFALIAERDGRPVGYAIVDVELGPEDTWRTGDRIAELQTLSVASAERGAGLGRRLLERVESELAAAGVRDIQIAVAEGNDAARGFYEAFGYRPLMVTLAKFDSGHSSPTGADDREPL